MATLILGRNQFDAVLFDLDGVLTDSAALHARSWKTLFDSLLEKRDVTVRHSIRTSIIVLTSTANPASTAFEVFPSHAA